MGAMNVLRELGRSIADEQDRRPDYVDPARIAARLRVSSFARRPRSGAARWAAGIAAALVAAAFAFFLVTKFAHAPLEYRVEGTSHPGRESTWISATDDPLPIGFSDGSRVVLGQGARARVTRLERTGAELAVEQGPVGLAIVPRKGNHWRVDLGPFVVEVTGTRFDVDWNPLTERFKLVMHEGTVVVSGCSIGSRSFAAGETLAVSCRDRQYYVESGEDAQRADRDSGATPSVAPEPTEPDAPAPRAATDSRTDTKWRALAEAGRYREALAAAEAAGFESECQRASASDLLSLAGAARLAGDAPRARQAYTLLRKRFASEPVAAVAAFNLARVAFDLVSDYGEAARWFRTYLREQPSGSLAPEAHGRLLEALQRSGDLPAARAAAKEYLTRYPTGPHAEFAKRLAR
jgi:TolA-binding protein